MVHEGNTRVPGTRPCTTPYEKEAMQSGILFRGTETSLQEEKRLV